MVDTTLAELYAHYAPSAAPLQRLNAGMLERELGKQTERQRSVVRLILQGMSHRKAGAELGISGGLCGSW